MTKVKTRLNLWFWGVAAFSLFHRWAGNDEYSNILMVIVFMALFASYIVEAMEGTQDTERQRDEE